MSDGLFLLVFGGVLVGAAGVVAVIRSRFSNSKSSNSTSTFGLQD